jgi:hypothetical protein
MNERIGQLAEQAGLIGPTSRVGNSHEATEKFAELIVRECYVIVTRNPHLSTSLAGANMKKHFGVE